MSGALVWLLPICGVQDSFLAVEPFILNTHTCMHMHTHTHTHTHTKMMEKMK